MIAVTARACVALFVCTTLLAAQQGDRKTATATWPEGKVTIEYGSPTWNERFKDQAQEGMVWRLGKNDPTRIEMTCGITTKDGAVAAGDYKLAVRYGADGRWDLLIYEGTAFHVEGLKTWTIEQASMKSDAEIQQKLEIGLTDEKSLTIAFGPYRAAYKLDPVKMHAPVNTEFAGIPATVNVMALPVSDQPIKDLCVGNASAKFNEEMGAEWAMKLTMNGDKATLTFKNERAGAIAKEVESLNTLVGQMNERAAASPEFKDRIEKRVAEINKQIDQLKAEEALYQRFKSEQTVEGTVSKREKNATNLEFHHERPTGSIVLKFGAGDKEASFDVTPANFRERRRRE